MSSVGIEQYFPFDTGPGASATLPRWRSMGRLFIGSGVVPSYLNQFATTSAASILTVQPGAVWIDGFYGESNSNKTLSTSGLGPGLLVARMDPSAKTITLNYVPGTSTPHQDYNGYYEIPLYTVQSPTAVTDVRQFCNPIPERVAKGRTWRKNPYSYTDGAWHNYGFDTPDSSPCWANSYQFRCPYGADYFVTTQVGYSATTINTYMNTQLVRTNAATNTVDAIAWNGTPNTPVNAAGWVMSRIVDVVPCKPGDLLTLQHRVNVAGPQGVYGSPWATYFTVRALS